MNKQVIAFTILILLGLGAFQYVREKKDIESHPSAAPATPPPQIAAATPVPSGVTHVESVMQTPTPAARKVTPAPKLAAVTTPTPATRTPQPIIATPKPVATPAWGKTGLDIRGLQTSDEVVKKKSGAGK